MIIALIKDLPPIKAAIDNPTFAKILTINETYWLFSSKLLESSANADMVVSEPQKPTAANKEYFESRCHCCESTTNTPRIKAPAILTIKMLTDNVLKIYGDSVSLYLRNAPRTEPMPRKINSRPFIYCEIIIEGY